MAIFDPLSWYLGTFESFPMNTQVPAVRLWAKEKDIWPCITHIAVRRLHNTLYRAVELIEANENRKTTAMRKRNSTQKKNLFATIYVRKIRIGVWSELLRNTR